MEIETHKKRKPWRTKSTILLKEVSPADMSDFFSRMFWKSPNRAMLAEKLFRLLGSGQHHLHTYKDHCRMLGCGERTYYATLNAMRAKGICYSENRMWHVSGQFITRLEDLIECYERMTKFRNKWRR